MEKSIHLAISSIPIQQWNQVYDEPQAFEKGTIFPELDKPFFVLEQQNQAVKEQSAVSNDSTDGQAMLKQIQQTAFVLDDLRLFLDTHPEEQQALKLFQSTLKRKKALMKEFALSHYPLTVDCMADIYEENPDSTCYCWQEGPIPWEGACQ